MALAALGFALLSVVAAVVLALHLTRTESARTERVGAMLERSASMTETERQLARAEAIREVASVGQARRRTEAALLRILGAALGIGMVGAASLVVEAGPGELVTLRTAGGPVIHSAVYTILGLGLLFALGVAVVVACLGRCRTNLEAQRRLLARSGPLDRGQKSR